MVNRRAIGWILGAGPVACGLGVAVAVLPPLDLLWILIGLVVYGSALTGLVWLTGFATRGFRLRAALNGGFYDKALRCLDEWGRNDELLATLRDKVPFPDDAIKERIIVTVRELQALQATATDPSNPHISEDLRGEIIGRCRNVMISLWPRCQDLSLLARPELAREAVRAKVVPMGESLDQLAEMIAATRLRLSNVTLEGSSLEIHDALESVGAMKWRVEEAPRIQAMVEGR